MGTPGGGPRGGVRLKSAVVTRDICIAVTAADDDWAALLREIDDAGPAGRVTVRVRPSADRELQDRRVGSVLARGYSLVPGGGDGEMALTPVPSGILYVVSASDGHAAIPPWLPLVPAGRFRQYLVGVALSQGAFCESVTAFAGESWHLDEFIDESEVAEFVMEFVASRDIGLVQILHSKVALDLLPALRFSFPRLRVVIDLGGEGAQSPVLVTYATARYGNLVDLFFASDDATGNHLEAAFIPPSKIRVMPDAAARRPEAMAQAHQDAYGQLLASSVG